MSQNQDCISDIRNITRRALKTNIYLMTPLMFGLAAISENFIYVVFSDRWMFAAPYLVVFSIIQSFRPFYTANLSAIKALGRSDIFYKLEYVKDFLGILILVFTVRYGVYAIAICVLVNSIICIFINSFPNKKLLNYGLFEQVFDVITTIILGAIMALCVFFLNYLCINRVLLLLIQIVVGVVIYLFGSIILHIDSFEYIKSILLLGRANKNE